MTPLLFDPRDAPHLDLLRDALETIARQVEAIDLQTFLTDIHIADAVALQLMIVGERANKLSSGFKAQFPDVEWPKIISLRHLIAHEYDRVDRARIWDIAISFAPALYATLPAPPEPETFD